MGTERPKVDLMPGTLDMLVLKVLMRGHLHGYAIAQLIQQLSGDLLRVEEGSLYPALQRLELNGWIDGEWGLSPNNRRARFYKLTPDGRKHLAAESVRYRQVTGAVRWADCMHSLVAAGANLFIEVGPGKVLCGLLKQIDPTQKSLNVEDPASLEATLAALAAPESAP